MYELYEFYGMYGLTTCKRVYTMVAVPIPVLVPALKVLQFTCATFTFVVNLTCHCVKFML